MRDLAREEGNDNRDCLGYSKSGSQAKRVSIYMSVGTCCRSQKPRLSFTATAISCSQAV